jgi:hypothetical protein
MLSDTTHLSNCSALLKATFRHRGWVNKGNFLLLDKNACSLNRSVAPKSAVFWFLSPQTHTRTRFILGYITKHIVYIFYY